MDSVCNKLYIWFTKTIYISDQLLFAAFLNTFNREFVGGRDVTKVIDKKKKISDVPQWFEGCRLNYAENLLRYRDDRVAIYGLREYVRSHFRSEFTLRDLARDSVPFDCLLLMSSWSCYSVVGLPYIHTFTILHTYIKKIYVAPRINSLSFFVSFLFGVTHAIFACQRWGLPHTLAQCATSEKGLV